MGVELLADEIDGRLHVAVVKKGVVDNLYVDAKNGAGAWGSLYLGKVSKIDRKLDAAFVDLGGGLVGFLPAKHVHLPGANRSEARTGIADLLKPGQIIMVQVKTEARQDSAHEHHKLPRLTTKIYLFGQYLIYSPMLGKVVISEGIENEDLYKMAAKLKGKGGWIIRPAAETATEEALQFESQSLLSDWQDVQNLREAGLLRPGPDAVTRALNDYGAALGHIHAGNKKILDRIIAWSEKHAPALAASKRLRLFKPVSKSEKLFDMHDVYSTLDVLGDAHVPLKSGGSLIIERTQAFTVIDVNQGSAAGTAAVNAEAVLEAARQTRLRSLSGAILIDFISMPQKSERTRLIQSLEAAFARDFAGAQVHGLTRLGIAEVTRKRRGASLAEKLEL